MSDALTFEKVWLMFQELREQQREVVEQWKEQQKEQRKEREERQREIEEQRREFEERRKEFEERRKERQREFEEQRKERQREIEALQKETARQMKETDRKIGELGNRFGELAEHLVVPSIKEKFNELGFTFEQISQDIQITDAKGNFLAEIDILLENGGIVIAVEVKSKPDYKDIDAHIERMEVLRRRADARGDGRKFQGAIAGAIMKAEVSKYAHKAGFYVIEQSGDTVKINIPNGFKPREW